MSQSSQMTVPSGSFFCGSAGGFDGEYPVQLFEPLSAVGVVADIAYRQRRGVGQIG